MFLLDTFADVYNEKVPMFVKINKILDLPKRLEERYIIGSQLGLKREDIDHCIKSADVFEKVRQQNPTVKFTEFVSSLYLSKSKDIRQIICKEFHSKADSSTVTNDKGEGVANRARDHSLNTDEELSELEDKIGQPFLKPNVDIRPGRKRSRVMSLPDRLSSLQ